MRGTIPVCFVTEALVEPVRRGMAATPLLAQAGIDPERLHQPGASVTPQEYSRLWHTIAIGLDCEFFGMDSRPMRPGSFTLLCHAVLHAGTLDRALARALRFFRIVLDQYRGSMQREGGRTIITLQEDGPPQRAFAYATFWLLLHGLACWLAERRLPMLAVEFRCPAPDYVDDLRLRFGRTIRFDQPHSRLILEADGPALPIRRTEQEMKTFLRSAPADFLVLYRSHSAMTPGIRRLLRDTTPAQWPDFPQLARSLHMAPSSLRRRLAGEGTSYREMKEQQRRDLALAALEHSDEAVAVLSARLGFAEPSAFHRAFRSWTGQSPAAYRAGQRRQIKA